MSNRNMEASRLSGASFYDTEEYDAYYKQKLKQHLYKSLIIMFNSDEYDTFKCVINAETEQKAFYNFFKDNPSFCFDDILNYQFYETKLYEDGWYYSKNL